MKFKNKIKINASIEDIIDKFSDRDNMGLWMKGFQSYKLVKGEDLNVGAVSIMILNIAGKKIELKETILENNLPNSFLSKYEADGVCNIVKNSFENIDNEQTIWFQELNFQFKSITIRIFSKIVVTFFNKLNKSVLKDFKNFIEKGKLA